MKNLFAYGTLMCEDIMHMVSGTRCSPVAGVLTGYSRRAVKDEHYPAVLPDPRGQVEGMVYRNIPPAAWGRLDRFEDVMYERTLVQVELHSGATIAAETYVARPEYLHRLDEAEWDFHEFLRHWKARFQQQYQGYRSL